MRSICKCDWDKSCLDLMSHMAWEWLEGHLLKLPQRPNWGTDNFSCKASSLVSFGISFSVPLPTLFLPETVVPGMPWHVEKIWMSVQRRTSCFSCVLQVWVCTRWLSLWSCKSHIPYTTWVLISNGHRCCSSFVCLWRFGIPSNWKPTSRTKYAVEGTFLDVFCPCLQIVGPDCWPPDNTKVEWKGRSGWPGCY